MVAFAIMLAMVAGYVYFNRSAIFNYFAEKFVQDSREGLTQDNGELSYAFMGDEERVVKAVESASPAVISIVVTKDVPVIDDFYFNDPFFDFFGRQPPRGGQGATEPREVGSGSGFIVSADGLAVTNRHVVADEKAEYTAFGQNGEQYKLKIVAIDPLFDIAVIQLEGDDFTPLTLGDSSKIKTGQSVIAIGNALGEFAGSVSVGVISGLSRSIVASSGFGPSELLDEVIQTDAAINPGNSGGPLLDLNGRVIGVNVAVASGVENIGFAIPSEIVANILDSIEKHGRIVRPYLGVRYIMINERVKELNKLSVDHGALIVRGDSREELAVMPGTPADKAGLRENDIILEVDGAKLTEGTSLAGLIRRKGVNNTIELKVLSQGKEKTVQVTLEEMR